MKFHCMIIPVLGLATPMIPAAAQPQDAVALAEVVARDLPQLTVLALRQRIDDAAFGYDPNEPRACRTFFCPGCLAKPHQIVTVSLTNSLPFAYG